MSFSASRRNFDHWAYDRQQRVLERTNQRFFQHRQHTPRERGSLAQASPTDSNASSGGVAEALSPDRHIRSDRRDSSAQLKANQTEIVPMPHDAFPPGAPDNSRDTVSPGEPADAPQPGGPEGVRKKGGKVRPEDEPAAAGFDVDKEDFEGQSSTLTDAFFS